MTRCAEAGSTISDERRDMICVAKRVQSVPGSETTSLESMYTSEPSSLSSENV